MATYNFDLEVITPVHIGMGKEKDYIKGLDYLYDEQNGKYSIINQEKLLNSLPSNEINAVSGFFSRGKFDKFNDYIYKKKLLKNDMIVYTWASEYGDSNEVKRHIQDAMGHWIIPGSSIKGSLRGIILTYLYNRQPHPGELNETNLLGNINNNLMRFVQVTDCVLETTPGIYPIKIFSADPNAEGQWKHRRQGGHGTDFNPTGFVTFYEMLTDGIDSEPTAGSFRLNFGTSDFLFRKRKDDVPNLKTLFSETDGSALINIIRDHTDNFLQKEIAFFEHYPNPSLTRENFFDELNWLKEENLRNPNSCILRIGANEGWHSITGDWKFDDFIAATENNRNNFVGRGRGIQKAYKTRKIIFDWDNDNEDPNHRRFVLPGFVKITLQPE